MKDELFKGKLTKQFEFDKGVTSVFDGMINCSVPFYRENLKLCANLIKELTKEGAKVCDLDCSSANFLIFLASLRKDLKLFGTDNASSILEIARSKAQTYGLNIEFFETNLCDFVFFQSSVFVTNYTLQFIRPPKRQELVNETYKNLNKSGIFIISEKILYEDTSLSKNMIGLYADCKERQGYSKIEIAAKREALENVLIPYSRKKNLDMLKNVRSEKIESVFRWVNFKTFITFK